MSESEIRADIPKEFYRGDIESPKAYTVGQVIEHLKRLPAELNVEAGFGTGVAITVYNADSDKPAVEFDEIED